MKKEKIEERGKRKKEKWIRKTEREENENKQSKM